MRERESLSARWHLLRMRAAAAPRMLPVPTRFDKTAVQVYIQGKGALKVGDLEIGDRVLAASTDGKPVSSEVIFMHDHKDVSTTVQIYVAEDMMELTPAHMVAVQTESCGRGYCSDAELVPAKEIRAGDKIYVTDGATTAVQVWQQTAIPAVMLRHEKASRKT